MYKARMIFASVALLAVVVWVSTAAATTNYVFVSVNGDTSAVAMTQGDTLSWGSNIAVGATMQWIIAIDLNGDSTFTVADDLLIEQFNATDGASGGGDIEDDADGVANGWYQSGDIPAGIAPRYYILRCTDLTDSSWAEDGVTVLPLSLPPNIITGEVSIPGVVAPNSLLENIWVAAEGDSDTMSLWSGLTNDSGYYEINVGASGTGTLHSVDVTNITGFITPEDQSVTPIGTVPGVDFVYVVPSDSLYGPIEDQFGGPLNRFIETFAWQDSGSISRHVETSDGSFSIYFAAAEVGNWRIGVRSDNLLPDYMVPRELEYDYQGSSGTHTFVCYSADSAIYGLVTENGGAPANSYRLRVESDSLGSWSEAVANSSGGGAFEAPTTSLDPNSWRVSLINWDDDYPIPPGLVLASGAAENVAPGDTVVLNLISGHSIQDTLRLDAGDPPVSWDDVRVSLYDGSRYFEGGADSMGVFIVYSDTGTFDVSVGADGYLADPGSRSLTVTGDTIGGLPFTINRAHSRVSGTLTNVALPLTAPLWISADTDAFPNGYNAGAQVDSATGTFELWLCDGDWTLHTPFVTGYDAPGDSSFTVGESPDTARTINLEYSLATGIGDDKALKPDEFSLHQNYPNPFNMSTRIQFTLAQPNHVTLEVFDLLGRSVVILAAGMMPAGNNSIEWNGRDALGKEIASGVYFYRLQLGDRSESRKLLLLK